MDAIDFTTFGDSPDQNWLHNESPQNPAPPGDSEYDWGMSHNDVWDSIVNPRAGPSDQNASNADGPSNYQAYTQDQGQDPLYEPYGSHVEPLHDAYAYTTDILPLPSLDFDFQAFDPQRVTTINPSVIATAPSALEPIQKTPTPPPACDVSPLDSLAHAIALPGIKGVISPLTIKRVTHRKRTIAPPAPIDTIPDKSLLTSEHSSSSIQRAPEVKKRNLDPNVPTSRVLPAGTSTHRPVLPLQVVDMKHIRVSITPEALRAGRPVPLFKKLRTRVAKDETLPPDFTPNPDELLEIVTALKDHAPDHYLKAMADDEKYTIVIRKWLRKCIREPEEWGKVTAPLLGMLSRTDMPVDYIVEHKFGKQAVAAKTSALEQNLPNAQEITVASDKYVKYITTVLIPKNRRSDAESDDENTVKKRKLEDGTAKDEKPGSSSKVSQPTSSKEQKPSTKAATDMSFFTSAPAPKSSAFQPRNKLPDIKKRDSSTAPPATAGNAASAPSLLAKTLAMLKKGGDAPPSKPIAGIAGTNVPPPKIGQVWQKKPNKNGHIVRFIDLIPDGGPLESVKLFKEEAHELEPAPWQTDSDDVHGASAHDLDKGEGRALIKVEAMEEEITWYEPGPYAYTEDPEFVLKAPTPETMDQDNRELGILAVNYPGGHVPPEPDETGVKIVEPGERTMIWEPPVTNMPPVVAPVPNVTALLGQLNPTLFNLGVQPPMNHYGAYAQPPQPQAHPQVQAQTYAYNYPQPAQPQYPPQQGYEQRWSAQSHPYEPRPDDEDRNRGGNRGRGGRGRGGGTSHGRIVCKHWLKNDCHRGENCTFRHSV